MTINFSDFIWLCVWYGYMITLAMVSMVVDPMVFGMEWTQWFGYWLWNGNGLIL